MNYKSQHIDAILLACKKQDQKAQLELYQRYHMNAYHAAYRILKNSDDAMDAMQEAFILAFQRLNQFSGVGNFGGWIHKIVVRKSIEYYHKNKSTVFEDELDNNIMLSENPEDLEAKESKINAGQLEKALNKISQRYQIILKLYYLEGYDHSEISEIMNWSPSNCRTTLSRAREQLKKHLNE